MPTSTQLRGTWNHVMSDWTSSHFMAAVALRVIVRTSLASFLQLPPTIV